MIGKNAGNVIGTNVSYLDYLGYQRFGKIAWIEPYLGDQDDPEKTTVWVYIVDEDPQYNVHEFIVNMGSLEKPDIKHIMYAELRLSTEVVLDEA